ncbi:MFS transporter [Erythrobacter sp.]|uniref:MFS transporter n=1 Tax=Erythrobacter sp. TaxID=1042 RepID=UPI002ECF847C|nr:MFS transporter [Erythrobacter sp.]
MKAFADRIRAEDIPLSRRAIAFILLMVFEFFYGWSWNTVDVLRPQIREELGLTLTQAGSAYTAQSLGALIGAIGFGALADRFGRRPVLFAIVLGTAAAAAAGAFVGSYIELMAQRFILGLFLGANFPVLIAMYMGLFSGRVRAKLTSVGQGTYNLSVIALGFAYGFYAERPDWEILLLIGSVPALLLSPLILWLVPDDRRMIPWGTDPNEEASAQLPLLELFSPVLRRNTWLLFLLVSLNFFAYQAFAGWTTTYLQNERGFGPETIGHIISLQFTGALIGGFFWGWFSDRYGRKPVGIGFAVGASAIWAYLTLAETPTSFAIFGFAWGFTMTASVAWAPWISEMYPTRVRSSAMSIFNWGRVVSMTAPLVTGEIAASFGLGTAMSLAVVGFAIGAVLWFMLPETHRRKTDTA